MPNSPAPALLEASKALSRKLAKIRFDAPVAYVYDPLDYAEEMVRAYFERYARAGAPYLLLGMNPGPFGMAQTGIPFGEVTVVKEWLKLDGAIRRPKREHPKRPVLGLACTKSEVSGRRLWGAISAKYPTPKPFFARAFVANYCPLLFLEASGRNLTPDKITRAARDAVERACDEHLRAVVSLLGPKVVVGVGQYAAKRAIHALPEGTRVEVLLHPSPASPAANRGWEALAKSALASVGIDDLL